MAGYDAVHDDGPGFVGIRFCQEWYDLKINGTDRP